MDISTGAQKEPWFTRLNPNGRIPVLVDPNRGSGHAVFESGAILLYLAQHYDTLRKFAADAQADPESYSEVLQWIFFTVRPRLRSRRIQSAGTGVGVPVGSRRGEVDADGVPGGGSSHSRSTAASGLCRDKVRTCGSTGRSVLAPPVPMHTDRTPL